MKGRFWKDLGYGILTFLWSISAIATGVGLIANVVWTEFDPILFYVGIGGAVVFIPISIYLRANEEARKWIFVWLLPF